MKSDGLNKIATINCFIQLLSDAEILKNIPQHFVRRNIPGNFAQVMQAFPDILRHELPAEAGFQSGDYAFYGCQCMR